MSKPWSRKLLDYFRWVMLLTINIILISCRVVTNDSPSTAFFYGRPIPDELFARYQRVVVEAENLLNDDRQKTSNADIFIYISVGEAERWRTGYASIDQAWMLGVNPNWGSDIVDLTQQGWQQYLLEQRILPLWRRGYRHFFLDTLDSYRLVISDKNKWLEQQKSLIKMIRKMHQRFPGIQLLFNRAFDIMPEVNGLAVGVVAESLFYSWNSQTKCFVEVAKEDHDWLLNQLNIIRDQYQLPIVVIDYLPTKDRELALDHAKKIFALGFVPWIAEPLLDTVGIGLADIK